LKRDYGNSSFLVLGLARSGLAAARLLMDEGAEVTGADENSDIDLSGEMEGMEVKLGPFDNSLLEGCDQVVVSPGIPLSRPVIKEAIRRSMPVISELELGFRFARGEIIAITGTNGKSTTVSMIESVLKAGGLEAIAAGNIGKPLCSVVASAGAETILVLEVSSFQLESVTEFKPRVAGILNMTPDHLDRYDSVEEYYEAKKRIYMNCGTECSFVYNAADPRCSGAARDFPGRLLPFSSSVSLNSGVVLRNGTIVIVENGEVAEEIINLSELKVVGIHNAENSMAAVAAAREFRVGSEVCREALSSFRGLKHRMQLVRSLDWVDYYNDSKATNVEGTLMSLKGMPVPVNLIAGGLDKGSDYSKLLSVSGNIRNIVLIGEAAKLIEKAVGGRINVRHAKDIPEAVRVCRSLSEPGMAVVLSPACASFDMFSDYRERGEKFIEAVRQLKGEGNGQE